MAPETENQEIEETELSAERFSLPSFCTEASSLLLSAYLFVIFSIFPFYMQNGYTYIGKEKFFFYRDITIGAFCLIVPFALASSLLKRNAALWLKEWYKKISMIDFFVLLYTIAVLLSYAFSRYRQQALWGEDGWYMGLLTQLLFVFTYFLITRYWECEVKLIYAFLAASAVVFAIGLMNRFSLYPLVLEGQNNGFLSTLGNINWYCGFWAVAFPIGMFLYWSQTRLLPRIFLGLYCLISFATGVSQGSNSAFIALVGVFLLAFVLSFASFTKMRRFFELCALLCISCQLQRVWRLLQPEAFNYYSGSLSDLLTMSRISLYVLLPIGVIYLLLFVLEKKKAQDIKQYRMIRQITVLLCFICIGVYFLLLFLNSNIRGGIRFMAHTSFLTFSEYWGSSRGGTWSAGYRAFQSMTPLGKLIGAGPDCFAMYLYSIESIAETVADQFGDLRLTNAHFELLTVLVNNGILGLIGYAGMLFRAIYQFISIGLKRDIVNAPVLIAAGAAVFSYTLHNIVSFQQILSTPFMFLLLAIGSVIIKESRYSDCCSK